MKKALDSTATPAEAVESPGLIKIVAFFCPSVVFIAFLCCPLIVWLLLRSMAYDQWVQHDAATFLLLATGGLPAMAGLMDMWRRRDDGLQLERFVIHTVITPVFGGIVALLSVFVLSNVPSIHAGIEAQARHIADMYSDPFNALVGGSIFAVIIAYFANGLFAFHVWFPVSSFANPQIVKSIMFFSSWYFDTRTAEGRELEAQQDRLRVWLARIFAVATTLIGITIMVGLTASGWTEDVAGRGLHNDIVGTGLVGSLTPEEFKQLNSVAFWWLLAACVFVVALAVPINRRIRAIRQRSLQVNLYRYDDSSEPDNFDDY